MSEETLDEIRESFSRYPTQSIYRAPQKLNIPRSTVDKVLCKILHIYAYKVKFLPALKSKDLPIFQKL